MLLEISEKVVSNQLCKEGIHNIVYKKLTKFSLLHALKSGYSCFKGLKFVPVSVYLLECILSLHDLSHCAHYLLSHRTDKEAEALAINLCMSLHWPHNQYDLLPDGTLLYERVPNKPEAEKAAMNNISPSLLKRRAYEEVNGMDGKDLN
jgi:hypothetical protein